MEWGFPQAARTLAQGNPLDPLQAIDANRKFQRFDQLAVDLPEPVVQTPRPLLLFRKLTLLSHRPSFRSSSFCLVTWNAAPIFYR
jgi:hypothetical protein